MLNQEGIEQLKADLRANAARYDQNNFGETASACGTIACMAGMCYLRKVGEQVFLRRILDVQGAHRGFMREQLMVVSSGFMDDCIQAGVDQLGLTLTDERPLIFESAGQWPHDLRRAYSEADNVGDHEAMVEVACAALDRMDEYGHVAWD
jgi:hypothetical protein